MIEAHFCHVPEFEGFYVLFTPYGPRDYDYDAVRIVSRNTATRSMVCVGNDGSSWPAEEREHVWYYGPINPPENGK